MPSKKAKSGAIVRESTTPQITPGRVATLIAANYRSGLLPTHLQGSPGVGKSETTFQATGLIAKYIRKACGFIDIRLAQMDPPDVRGLPSPLRQIDKFLAEIKGLRELIDHYIPTLGAESKEAKEINDLYIRKMQQLSELLRGSDPIVTTEWCSPDILPMTHRDGECGILMLDELRSARPEVQVAAYQLINDRRIGNYELPPGWMTVGASNGEDDRAVVYPMSSALANRMIHFEVIPSVKDWTDWAFSNDVHPYVVGYIGHAGSGELFQHDPDRDDLLCFPTPRSWVKVSKILTSGVNGEDAYTQVAGAIGEPTAGKFLGFLSLKDQIEDVDVIMRKYRDGKHHTFNVSGTVTAMDPVMRKEDGSPLVHTFSRASIVYLTCAGLASRANDQKNWDTLWQIADDLNRQAPDFAVEFMLNCLRTSKGAITRHKNYVKWAEKHSDTIDTVLADPEG